MSVYLKKIFRLKNKPESSVNVKNYAGKKIRLRVLTSDDLVSKKVISNLSKWRDKHSYWFGGNFKVTNSRTKKWLQEQVLQKEDRILFMIEDQNGKEYGHLGFNRYDSKKNSCELDNVVRGVDDISGLMTDCVASIIRWGFKNLKMDNLYLITFMDNTRAVNLYKRNGFKIIGKIPLKKVQRAGETFWEKIIRGEMTKPKRFYVKMKFND